MSKYGLIFLCFLSTWIAWFAVQAVLDKPKVLARGQSDGGNYVDIQSTTYVLDQVYLSMQGPRGNQARLSLDLEARPQDTLWLTGLKTINVDADTGTQISDEFFCHSNLTFCPQSTTPEDHNAAFEKSKHMEWRLFTLVPGRMELNLPSGFGIPIKGATQFDYFTMALNQNAGPERSTRMRTRLCYRLGHESGRLRPLFRRGLYVYQQHTQSNDGFHQTIERHPHEGEHCAESCELDLVSETASTFEAVQTGTALDQHPGATCCVVNASNDGVTEQFGADNTVHWMVPPGKHQYRTNVTKQMQLPFDTTVHYVTGHLHPFGHSLSMVDLDSGETVFEITAENYADRKGVKRMSEIQSSEGVPIRRDGRYELKWSPVQQLNQRGN